MHFSYHEFANIFLKHGREKEGVDQCIKYCENKSGKLFKDDEHEIALKKFKSLALSFTRYWTSRAVNRTWKCLENCHRSWLQKTLEISISLIPPSAFVSIAGPGRPTTDFDKSSARSKRRKVQHVVENNEKSSALFLQSAQKVSNLNDEKSLSDILALIINAPDLEKILYSLHISPIKMTPTEALALYIDADMTKSSYQKFRNSSLLQNADIFPTYNAIGEEKAKCYPEGN
jgi:hypothetical protein